MSVGILDLTYGNSFKPGLTATPIPINQTLFLSGITFNSGSTSFQFAATGNYQCTVNVDSDFGADAGSRIVIEAYNATTGVILDSFSIDGNSGDASWIMAFSVTDISHQFQIRAITFTTLPGTIKAVRIVACDLGGGGSGNAPADGPYVTYAVDADLTNARVLTAGTDITLDTTTPGQIIVNASGGGFITAVQLPLEVGTVAPDTLSLGTAQGPTTPDATSSVTWSPSANNSKGLVLQGLASQSVPMLQVQTSTGAICFNVPVPTGTLTGANNNLIGIGAGDGLTSGTRNFIAGNDAGGSNSSGAMSDTVMIGHNAGLLNTANENIFIGSLAGDANTSATGNTYVGYNSGTANNGNNNVAVGHTALAIATSGAGNVAVGFEAMGTSPTSASQNVAIGYQAGKPMSGANSVFVGYRCGDLGSGSADCTFVGAFSGQDNTGDQNTFIGSLAGSNQTSGTSNVAIGYSALGSGSAAITGTVAIGWAAGNANTASNNTFIGYGAGDANTSGTGQVIIGYNAGTAMTGSSNTIIGHQAGDGLTTGSQNVFIGKDAGGAAGATSMSDVVAIGYNAGLLNTSNECVFIGSGAGAASVTSDSNTLIGYRAGFLLTGNFNTIVGKLAGDGITTGSRNTIFGREAGGSASSGAMSDTVLIGLNAGVLNTANENTIIGSFAGDANTSGTGQCFVGYNAGTAVTGSSNTLIGHSSGDTITTGTDNVIIGTGSDIVTNTHANAVIIGSGATGEQSSVSIGSGAVSGTSTIVLGRGATGNGLSNTFIAGSSSFPMDNVYFGKGFTNSSANAYTINGTGGSGTDNAGANLQLAGGKGTGTAEPGLVVLKYPLKTTTGTTLQSLSTQSYPVSTTLFSTTAGATVTGSVTTAETTLLTTVVGSQSLEGGMLRVGRTLRFRIFGHHTSSASPSTLTLRIKYGSTAIETTAITPAASQTTRGFSIESDVTITSLGASGTYNGDIHTTFENATTGISIDSWNFVTGGINIDTTATSTLDITAQYGSNTAGNSVTLITATCEILN